MSETQADYVTKSREKSTSPDELEQLRQRVAELEEELEGCKKRYSETLGWVQRARDENKTIREFLAIWKRRGYDE